MFLDAHIVYKPGELNEQIVKYVKSLEILKSKYEHYKELLKWKANRKNILIAQFVYDPKVEYHNINKDLILIYKLKK